VIDRGRSGLIWRDLAALVAILLLALFANRDAYGGWFEDDDLDTMTWARLVPLQDLLRNVPSLRYPPEHARPLGYFYYGALFRTAGFAYPAWIAVLQFIQALNVVLLWLLLRKLGFRDWALAAGCLFFAMHRALFDAWWKPMFIYDVLATTFALVSVLAYASRHWVLSFAAFWLALRTKETGLSVPAILACYEMLGGRNWKRLVPFFVPALIYGGYGLYYNLHLKSGHLYALHADFRGLWKSLNFYFAKLLWIRYAGFALLLAPLAVRDRRLYFGLAAMLSALALYLLLPGRMSEVYLCLPLTGAAVAIAALTACRPALAALAVLVWIPWQFALLRKNVAPVLAAAADRKAFVAAVREVPDAAVYVYGSVPASLHSWGVEGALRLFHKEIKSVRRMDEVLPQGEKAITIDWDAKTRSLRMSPEN
jgi:hypothetical protein